MALKKQQINELKKKAEAMHSRVTDAAALGQMVEKGELKRLGSSQYYVNQSGDVYQITGRPTEKEKKMGYQMHVLADVRSSNVIENELKNVAPYAHSLANNMGMDVKDAFAVIRSIPQAEREQFTKDLIELSKFAQQHPTEIAVLGYSLDELNDFYTIGNSHGKDRIATAVEESIDRSVKVGIKSGELAKSMSSNTQEQAPSEADIKRRMKSFKKNVDFILSHKGGEFDVAKRAIFKSLFPIEIMKKQGNELSNVIRLDGLNAMAPFWKKTAEEIDRMTEAGESYDEAEIGKMIRKNITDSREKFDRIMKSRDIVRQIENPKFMKSIEAGTNAKANRALEKLAQTLRTYVPYYDLTNGIVRGGTSPALEYFKYKAKEHLDSPEFKKKTENMCKQNKIPKYLAPALGAYPKNYYALKEILENVRPKNASDPKKTKEPVQPGYKLDKECKESLEKSNKAMYYTRVYGEGHKEEQSKIVILDNNVHAANEQEKFLVSNETAVRGYIIAEQFGIKGIDTLEKASLLCQMYEGPIKGGRFPEKEGWEMAEKLYEQGVAFPEEFYKSMPSRENASKYFGDQFRAFVEDGSKERDEQKHETEQNHERG